MKEFYHYITQDRLHILISLVVLAVTLTFLMEMYFLIEKGVRIAVVQHYVRQINHANAEDRDFTMDEMMIARDTLNYQLKLARSRRRLYIDTEGTLILLKFQKPQDHGHY